MAAYVVPLDEVDETGVALVGGKGAHLGALIRMQDVPVPAGFCITTDAFRRMRRDAPEIEERVARIGSLAPDDRAAIRDVSAAVRDVIQAVAILDDVAAEIVAALTRIGEDAPVAVRSSATAEDLPTASFAGLHDTYLNVVGSDAVLQQVTRCWASLFSERAVAYRLRNGVDHRHVEMAVVVQRMAIPEAAGVLFTADPLTGNRKVASIEAVFGLGESLVSGGVTPDIFKVRGDDIVDRTIAAKRVGPALTDSQVVRLVRIGRRIEAQFGSPQDIEWCLVDDDFQFVQSRPITTLFPVPVRDDEENHVYVSVGHQQMMTDPIKPLGISVWQLTAVPQMHEAGGRLFVDVTRPLASPASRTALLDALGTSDPLIGDALRTIADRGDFLPSLPQDGPAWTPPGTAPVPLETDPAIVTDLIERSDASIDAARRAIRSKSGAALFDFILEDITELKRLLSEPQLMQVVLAGIDAARWLNEQFETWLGERNAADVLSQSVPHNVSSEMGLALLDVADAIRPHPEVVAFLDGTQDDGFLDELASLPGGQEARDAIVGYLDRYGMRCAGEIDVTRPRWSEQPSTLLPLIRSHVRNAEHGAAARRFEQGRREAATKEHELLQRLRALPDGESKADEAKRMIERLRTFSGYREYPKYVIVSRYFIYRKALLEEASLLVQAGVLSEVDDIGYLTFGELHEVVRAQRVDDALLRRRKEAFDSHHALTPPRVLTSDGEIVTGSYRRGEVPAGALIGLPVSAGVVEGRARLLYDIADADVEPGDILVTVHTDPSWSPLFVSISGLVTEVGGLMTHGAVVAREYGLPAVVGVDRATQLIRDGQRIRVHGTDGYIELLE